MRVGNESVLEISEQVREYVRTARTRFPDGIELTLWDDASDTIRQRLSTLAWSLLQGGVLVLIILGLFIRPALAFWIVVGIPVSFAGAIIFMPWFGITANVMSLFGFIIVLGIVVDDAIVTGENVYSKMKDGMLPLDAAVQGAHEVAIPVTFGALTTIVAFLPLFFFEGAWGDFAKQIPPIVAPVLLFSLVESKLILPAHLKHLRLVMIDYINRRRQEGIPLREAAMDAGSKRFRPIILTSVTTFVGLLPLMLDRSLQAQFLLPMAVSLAFGVLFATTVTLYLVPCTLLVGEDLRDTVSKVSNWYVQPFRQVTRVREKN